MADGGIGNQSPATIFQARLDTTDGVSDTLTLRRYQGSKVIVSGVPVVIPSAGLSRDVADNLINSTGADAGGAPVVSTLYYVYISNVRASFSPESIRLSSQAPSVVNGVRYLGSSGNALNWRFVGWIQTDSTPQFVSSRQNRAIINCYNKERLSLFVCPDYVDDDAFTVWSFNNGTWARANPGGGQDYWVNFISNGEDAVNVNLTGSLDLVVPLGAGALGLGVDTVTSAEVSSIGYQSDQVAVQCAIDRILGEGAHLINMLCVNFNTAVGAVNVYADSPRLGAAADPAMTYLSGSCFG